MKGGLLVLAALLLACSSRNSSPVEPYPSEHVTLEPGKQASPVNGIFVTLIKVENDSRCPVDVVCVWQGDAEVTLGISGNNLDLTAPVVLHTGVEPREIFRYGYMFRLDSLTPAPHAQQPIPQASYRAWVSLRFIPD